MKYKYKYIWVTNVGFKICLLRFLKFCFLFLLEYAYFVKLSYAFQLLLEVVILEYLF